MARWAKIINIKHLFTEKEDYESVQKSMNAIADELDSCVLIPPFNTKKFRNIPKDNEFIEPVEYANKLLNKLYDYADTYGIWLD